MADTFADVIFKRIFLSENVKISIQISQKFVCRGSNDNESTLVQVNAHQVYWRMYAALRADELNT